MAEFWKITFQNHSKEETFEIIDSCLKSRKLKKPLIIATLNPELLLLSGKDEHYREILNKADLKNIDGFGIKLMTWLKRRVVSERIAGAELARYLLKKAIKEKLKIAFVFKKDGLSNLKDLKKFSNNFRANIKFIEYDILENEIEQNVNSQIQDREVVLVGLGAPYQEKFIYENKNYWPSLKLAIGIGGTFDFWTGKQKRAPRLMRKIGLEWFWRLITRPKRIWKIWKSTAVFTFKSLIKY